VVVGEPELLCVSVGGLSVVDLITLDSSDVTVIEEAVASVVPEALDSVDGGTTEVLLSVAGGVPRLLVAVDGGGGGPGGVVVDSVAEEPEAGGAGGADDSYEVDGVTRDAVDGTAEVEGAVAGIEVKTGGTALPGGAPVE
jgi:hypothetical protein